MAVGTGELPARKLHRLVASVFSAAARETLLAFWSRSTHRRHRDFLVDDDIAKAGPIADGDDRDDDRAEARKRRPAQLRSAPGHENHGDADDGEPGGDEHDRCQTGLGDPALQD